MSKKKDNTKKAEEKAPAAPETPEEKALEVPEAPEEQEEPKEIHAGTPDELSIEEKRKKLLRTFSDDERKIDALRIRKDFVDDEVKDGIIDSFAFNDIEFCPEINDKWFIIWVDYGWSPKGE